MIRYAMASQPGGKAGAAGIDGAAAKDSGDYFWEFSHRRILKSGQLSPEKAKLLIREIERRDSLVSKVSIASSILLQAETCEFENGLLEGMGMLASAVDADRLRIWRNSMEGGELYCAELFRWPAEAQNAQAALLAAEAQMAAQPAAAPLAEAALQQAAALQAAEAQAAEAPLAAKVAYSERLPGWETILSQGGCINAIVREMSDWEKAHFAPQGTLSIFVAPIFVQNEFWGFIGYEHCRRERLISPDEQAILRSTGLLLAGAWLRHEMMLSIKATAGKLDAAAKEAREASSAKSKFLANMSHEMRTPLNTVIGMSQLLMEDSSLSLEALESLEKINHAGENLLSTVNGILDISKIEEGKFELVPVEYDVCSLIHDSVTQNAMRISGKPIRFILDIDGSLPQRLHGDDLQIKHILSNLLSNAFKYTTEGTVRLGIKCERSGKDAWLSAEVSDTGAGIRREDMGSLFAEYTKFDTKSNRKIEGTGLGLCIAKNLAEMMGGSIDAKSEYGKGSVFTVRLRQQIAAGAEIGEEAASNLKKLHHPDHRQRRPKPVQRESFAGARALVVDDVQANLDVAKGMLAPYGIQVDCAASGNEAIEALRSGKNYDVIFMDHMMPEMDGIETARIIREEIDSECARTAPIIAFTANAIVGSEEMFLSHGFQAFISKPIDIGRLDAALRRWIKPMAESAESQSPPPPPPPPAAGSAGIFAGVKIDGLSAEKGLKRMRGSEASYIQILKSFISGSRPLLATARSASRDSLAGYAIAVHGIKGAAANIGADGLAGMAKALEEAAGKGDFDSVKAGNEAMVDAAEKLIGDLREFLQGARGRFAGGQGSPERAAPGQGAGGQSAPGQSAGGQPGEKPESGPGGEALARLLAACEEGDIDAADKAMAEIEMRKCEVGAELAEWLRENVDSMSHAKIAERLKGG